MLAPTTFLVTVLATTIALSGQTSVHSSPVPGSHYHHHHHDPYAMHYQQPVNFAAPEYAMQYQQPMNFVAPEYYWDMKKDKFKKIKHHDLGYSSDSD